jgi:hypothetical protein
MSVLTPRHDMTMPVDVAIGCKGSKNYKKGTKIHPFDRSIDRESGVAAGYYHVVNAGRKRATPQQTVEKRSRIRDHDGQVRDPDFSDRPQHAM